MNGIPVLENMLFVSNMGDDSISVVDINNRKQAAKIYLMPLSGKSGEVSATPKKPKIGPHSLKIDKSQKYLYSVNCFDDSVITVDTRDYTIRESFFSGSHPNDIVLNYDESYLYVTNGDSDSVSVIDTGNKKVVAQISVGVMPHGICMSPNGEYIYVANMESDSISIIDTWSNSKVHCIRVGRCPIEVITSRDGQYLYVTCSYLGCDRKGVVSVISTGSLKIIKSIEVGLIPVQMSISRNNRYLYVTDMGSNDVHIIDLNRFEVLRAKETGNMPRGIVLTEDGRIFVSNSEDNNISIINQDSLETLGNIEVGIEPTSMLYVKRTIA